MQTGPPPKFHGARDILVFSADAGLVCIGSPGEIGSVPPTDEKMKHNGYFAMDLHGARRGCRVGGSRSSTGVGRRGPVSGAEWYSI